MPIKVLVVDDSSFFRRRITEIINSDQAFSVIGQASNGQEAIEKTLQFGPDLITMDYEMPLLDGISAVKAIMKQKPTSILMFSSLTYEGARTTLDALEAGAKDFLPKSFESISEDVSVGSNELLSRLRALVLLPEKFPANLPQKNSPKPTATVTVTKGPVNRTRAIPASDSQTEATQATLRRQKISIRPKLCVIGASTGGPMALQAVLKVLPAVVRVPILVAQHMPGTFTEAFADRLNSLCQVTVTLAQNGDCMRPSSVYIAPGGMQTIIKDSSLTLSIVKGDERLNYRPSVDLTFASAAKNCPGKVLALVLTGMGADGADGARLLKQGQSEVWIQDEQSCVVFGMPQAVMRKGYYDEIMSIHQIGIKLAEVLTRGCT